MTRTELINQLTEELGWWKHTDLFKVDIEEFVHHEIQGLAPDQENQMINGLNYLKRVLTQFE